VSLLLHKYGIFDNRKL